VSLWLEKQGHHVQPSGSPQTPYQGCYCGLPSPRSLALPFCTFIINTPLITQPLMAAAAEEYLYCSLHKHYNIHYICCIIRTDHCSVTYLPTLVSLLSCFYVSITLKRYQRRVFYFLPARRYASAGNSDRNVSVCQSVCLSVRPSVTRRYCVKTKKASGMISSPSDSPKTLVI